MSIPLDVVYVPNEQVAGSVTLKPLYESGYPAEGEPLGHYSLLVNSERAELRFNTPELHDYYGNDTFIHELVTILNAGGIELSLNTWTKGATFASLKLRMFRAYWTVQVEAAGNVVPINHKVLDNTVRTINMAYPPTFDFVLSDTDLGDVVNEVGMGEIDQFSILNMLSHFHGLDYTRKAELMTVVAFSWKLDIHPMAVAITPWVIGVLRYTKQL